MPKLQRWIIASKQLEVVDKETIEAIESIGGQIGGGWGEIHQHICVNKDNKEKIEDMLIAQGFTISVPSERRVCHPECEQVRNQKAHSHEGQ